VSCNNWTVIQITHLLFRKAFTRKNIPPALNPAPYTASVNEACCRIHGTTAFSPPGKFRLNYLATVNIANVKKSSSTLEASPS